MHESAYWKPQIISNNKRYPFATKSLEHEVVQSSQIQNIKCNVIVIPDNKKDIIVISRHKIDHLRL